MKAINVLIAGIGGQGLVMTTELICQAAFGEGYDIKSNDVIGLAQRGGRVWGSVRIGKNIYSPNIPEGEVNLLLGIEPMEALRWQFDLKTEAKILLNQHQVYPTIVQQEQAVYPEKEIQQMLEKFDSLALDAFKEARECGNEKAANTLMVGGISHFLPISEEGWLKAIKRTYPEKLQAVNEKVWKKGRDIAQQSEFV
ncbi:indolepyruvate oxidoreductase subunit beta [Tindallia californiensis]|uniref:Indolepyruvate ferredoxin oxidoreductase beta subunit n=1 Tax=Tindallia californiensis TaxID=159292 RepID=A0A1H3M9M2_9FIRM|nr:indolepyruvate oxidoreductase subunit beta [Tindallia californiensis]SDY73447.1 indolepyruvate ferredoxin oxidoreductase beta subunit [Tindallia californiensis]